MNRASFLVQDIVDVGAGVKQFELVPADPRQRPWPHPPGAHVTISTPARANCYSLTGDGTRPEVYRISVRRIADGGGSAWLHDEVAIGDALDVSAPTSSFAPVATARHHLLIAAGIGVTPILSHARAAVRWSRPFSVVYGHPEHSAPHRDELAALAGDRFVEAIGRADMAAAGAAALRDQPVGTHAYACGPASLLDDLTAMAQRYGWPRQRVHVEHFGAPEFGPGREFELRVIDREAVVDVLPGTSALHALDAVGIRVPRLCERGVCGQCRTRVVSGTPEHRDILLSPEEQAANDCFYPCVSRASTPVLEVAIP